MKKYIYLSHFIDENTPTYGNREVFNISKKSSIDKGDIANDSRIETTVHIGTHIDMPYHFYENGTTLETFPAGFWIFDHPLFIDIQPNTLVIKDELIDAIEKLDHVSNTDILITRTGICKIRGTEKFWKENYGFDPFLADYFLHSVSIHVL